MYQSFSSACHGWRRFRGLVFFAGLFALLAGCGGGSANSTGITTPLSLKAVERQLAALPCPPGVSVELWDLLTAELTSELARRASASPLLAGPPLDELSKVHDLTASELDLATLQLRWSYQNTGDYDQNSETNISDLTPVGREFNKNSASPDWASAAAADGDFNGEVNVSDVTPIGRCYLQSVTHYKVEYKPSTGGMAAFSSLADVPFDDAQADGNGWLQFAPQYAAKTGYFRVVPYYNEQRGIAGDEVYFKISNLPPVAVLNADTQVGPSPLTVHFDASASSDPDPGTLTFLWDWEGNGVIDFDSGSDATVQHEYTDLGDYAPRVVVRDVAGAEDEDGVMVYCHEWEMYPITDAMNFGYLEVLEGKPTIIYWRRDSVPGDESLCFARSRVGVPASAEDWDLMTVVEAQQETDGSWSPADSTGGAFMLDGRPALVYVVANRKELYLAHATTSEPLSKEDWELSLISDVPEQVSQSIDAISVNDVVYVVVSSPWGNNVVLLVRSKLSNPAGPNDWEITQISNQGHNGLFGPSASIDYISEKLCVAINQMDEMEVHFATTTNLAPQGPEDWTYMIADDAGDDLSGPDLIGISLADIPIVISEQDAYTHLQGVRVSRSGSNAPLDSADWSGVTHLEGSYELGRQNPAVIGSICALSCIVQDESGTKDRLMLYPPTPGLEGLDQSEWTFEEVDPPLLESLPDQSSQLARDWIFQLRSVVDGPAMKLCFLRCKAKAYYTLW